MEKVMGGSAEADRATRASPEPASGLGHSASVPTAWEPIKYDGCYPEDEQFSAFDDEPLSFAAAAEWLLEELPRASEFMCCECDIDSGIDFFGKPAKLIKFSTMGWSGAESIVALIERRFDMSHFMLSWRRGGHYVFEIPCRLAQGIEAAPAGETRSGSTGTAKARSRKGCAQNTT